MSDRLAAAHIHDSNDLFRSEFLAREPVCWVVWKGSQLVCISLWTILAPHQWQKLFTTDCL